MDLWGIWLLASESQALSVLADGGFAVTEALANPPCWTDPHLNEKPGKGPRYGDKQERQRSVPGLEKLRLKTTLGLDGPAVDSWW